MLQGCSQTHGCRSASLLGPLLHPASGSPVTGELKDIGGFIWPPVPNREKAGPALMVKAQTAPTAPGHPWPTLSSLSCHFQLWVGWSAPGTAHQGLAAPRFVMGHRLVGASSCLSRAMKRPSRLLCPHPAGHSLVFPACWSGLLPCVNHTETQHGSSPSAHLAWTVGAGALRVEATTPLLLPGRPCPPAAAHWPSQAGP